MIFAAILLAAYIANTIELPLPQGIKEYGTVTGNIQDCDIPERDETKVGGNPEIGITLENDRSIYLRWKTKAVDINYIYELCESHQKISVSYKVNRTIISPGLSYWIESVSEI